ncbi:hypothetical protein EJK15_59295 [Nonomuraea basaltis]|nr:hypothetical protein EJK15_59295 [Nonomuraea basaltis]
MGALIQTSHGLTRACETSSKRECRYSFPERHTNGAQACVRWRPYERGPGGRVNMAAPSRAVSISTGRFNANCYFEWR